MKVMAFIPARGGSKGILRKNLALMNGKPLLQYTLEAAKQSSRVSEIFISSEDLEIINFCKSLGFDVPYERPEELATDTASLVDAMIHALEWRRSRGMNLPDAMLLLQPTSPLRGPQDIDGAIKEFADKKANTLVSVHSMSEHPYECVKMTGAAWEYVAKPAREVCRRQDYNEGFYFINGAIYIARVDFLLAQRRLVEEGISALYIMEPVRGIDIDTPLQLRIAESLMLLNCSTFRG